MSTNATTPGNFFLSCHQHYTSSHHATRLLAAEEPFDFNELYGYRPTLYVCALFVALYGLSTRTSCRISLGVRVVISRYSTLSHSCWPSNLPQSVVDVPDSSCCWHC